MPQRLFNSNYPRLQLEHKSIKGCAECDWLLCGGMCYTRPKDVIRRGHFEGPHPAIQGHSFTPTSSFEVFNQLFDGLLLTPLASKQAWLIPHLVREMKEGDCFKVTANWVRSEGPDLLLTSQGAQHRRQAGAIHPNVCPHKWSNLTQKYRLHLICIARPETMLRANELYCLTFKSFDRLLKTHLGLRTRPWSRKQEACSLWLLKIATTDKYVYESAERWHKYGNRFKVCTNTATPHHRHRSSHRVRQLAAWCWTIAIRLRVVQTWHGFCRQG